MPKQIVIEPCQINHGDDRGGVHHDLGEIVDLPKGTAIDLARAGRTLYMEKSDDPDKNGNYTASKEMVKAVQAMAAKAKEDASQPASASAA